MEESQVREIASMAAKEAVRDVFKLFGVDTAQTESVNDFRADLIHLRRARRMVGRMGSAAFVALAAAGALGLVALVWDAVRVRIVGGPPPPPWGMP